MMLSVVAFTAEEEVSEAVNWAVGGTAFGILVIALIALIVFGGGREHS
jgi:hypothetical protein